MDQDQAKQDTKTSGNAVDIVVTPEIAEVIARAHGQKIEYGLISQFVFPM